MDPLEKAVARAALKRDIADAVAKERERCARIVEGYLGATTNTVEFVKPLTKRIRDRQ